MSDHIAYTPPKPPNKLPTSNIDIQMFAGCSSTMCVCECVSFSFFFPAKREPKFTHRGKSNQYKSAGEIARDLLPDKVIM